MYNNVEVSVIIIKKLHISFQLHKLKLKWCKLYLYHFNQQSQAQSLIENIYLEPSNVFGL